MNIYNPIHIDDYYIYDVFYNDMNQYILICPMIKNYNFDLIIDNNILKLKKNIM